MRMSGYFDNSATTKPCPQAVRIFNSFAENNYGNPASLHSMGIKSHIEVEKAREVIANEISCQSNEIIFTSGGTQSNNMAILGSALANRRRGNRIVITAIEHPSVSQTADFLSQNGFEVIRLTVLKNGDFIDGEIEKAITADTILVSSMLVNNETGIILNTDKLKRAIQKSAPHCNFHIDAVQAFGKISVNVNRLGCDLLSISAHKIHAFKGVGALHKKKGTNIKQTVFGGGQESGLRSGTVPTELIGAFAEAVKQFDVNGDSQKYEALRSRLISKLEGANYTLNFQENLQKGIVSLALLGIKSEVLLHFLSERDIYVSSGSACSRGKKSEILKNLGLPDNIIDSTIRISFSRYNTFDEVDSLAEALVEAEKLLARKK